MLKYNFYEGKHEKNKEWALLIFVAFNFFIVLDVLFKIK